LGWITRTARLTDLSARPRIGLIDRLVALGFRLMSAGPSPLWLFGGITTLRAIGFLTFCASSHSGGASRENFAPARWVGRPGVVGAGCEEKQTDPVSSGVVVRGLIGPFLRNPGEIGNGVQPSLKGHGTKKNAASYGCHKPLTPILVRGSAF